mmetsp:Transcript_6116/g.9419  ORF Transcript_6116/g.9419 Transcript_6116/m.9419 type:complete len:285 (-) Transcript_6116:322-1176(-)
MGLFFSRIEKQAATFEKALEKISKQIVKIDARQKARARRKYRQLSFLTQSFVAIFGILLSILFLRKPPEVWWGRLVFYTPLIIIPTLYYMLRKVIVMVHERAAASDAICLEELKAKQQAKVDELKERTRFRSVQDVIRKYDASERANTGAVSPTNASGEEDGNQQNGVHPNGNGTASSATGLLSHFVDRLSMSEDADNPKNRFALICRHCYAHNGLARPEDYPNMQYYCPRCHQYNPPPGGEAPPGAVTASSTPNTEHPSGPMSSPTRSTDVPESAVTPHTLQS